MRARVFGMFSLGLALASSVAFGQANLTPVPWTQVRIKDSFWKPRQDALLAKTLPQQFEQLEIHKYKQNFERAAKREKGGYVGLVFNDSDVYKVLEAAAFGLGVKRDPVIEAKLDEWIELISRAQEADGYLNTHFQLKEPENKWKNLRDLHELYCAGHLFEAAAA
ncbi:MAG TPA: beta-L-arabinofuranosidase domain-containing protein, partial [Fimbriimonas sp.]|nr:beta-L-arabinofuranosidase domain-containing protein [Fimbriimonas sp.]